ncbi:MAG: hypothetical protein JRE14_01925 [Deltaproteobacteria bacterium]|nr:hypothetical protein [Deltaproteobacteria bacterium]MBW2632886.1 hypothetical protein [Deltaproteobacteria bacterium]
MSKIQKTSKNAEMLTKHIGLSIPVKIHKEFRAAAEQKQLSNAGLLRQLIANYLDEITND